MVYIAAELRSLRARSGGPFLAALALLFALVPATAFGTTARFEQNAAGVAYTSGWVSVSSSRLSGGSQAHTDLPGRRASLSFTGSSISILSNKAPNFGTMRVRVDGGTARDVLLRSSSTVLSTPVLTVSGLTDATHTVVIENLGGGFVSLDAFDVTGATPWVGSGPSITEPALALAEADAAAFARSSAWNRVVSSAFKDGDYHTNVRAGEFVTFRFTGTSAAWVGPVSPALGRSDVRLDGIYVGTVDQYAAAFGGNRVLWSVGGLTSAAHTVEIITRDDATIGRTTRGAAIDVFEVQGVLNAPPAYARLEQGGGKVAYAGDWKPVSSAALSGGGYYYTNQPGAGFAVAFDGTGVRVISPRFGWCGQFEVFIDGVPSGVFSAYSEKFVYGAPVYEIRSLSAGSHRIDFRALGTAARGATGVTIGIDAIDVFGVPATTTAPLRYAYAEEFDDRLGVSGAWERTESPEASAFGSLATTRSGDVVRVTINGTAFRLMGPKGPGMGSLQVYVDGQLRTTVAQEAVRSADRQTLYRLSGLAAGTHAIEVRSLTDGSGPAALDVIECLGSFAQTVRPAGWKRTESPSGAFGRTAIWSGIAAPAASGGTVLRTRDLRGAVAARFTGTSCAVIGSRGPDSGVIEVFVDGVSKGLIDLYDPVARDRCVLFRADGLSTGEHDLVVRVAGRWVKPSTSYFVSVDAIDVIGTLGLGVVPADASDYRAAFSSGWIEGGNPSVRLGGYRRSSAAGTWAQYRFKGTRFDWIGPKSPSYGIARVIIDGRVVGTVDQYAAKLATKQRLFSMKGLAFGEHVVRIVVTGGKNASSTGYTVGVDDFAADGDLIAQTAPQRARTKIISTAIAQLGKPYLWGAVGPSRFDCSGLVYYCYRSAGVYPPRTSRYQWRACSPKGLPLSAMLPGDLVFMDDPSYIHHVGIYLGEGMSIHAPQTGRNVEYRNSPWGVMGRLPSSYWPH